MTLPTPWPEPLRLAATTAPILSRDAERALLHRIQEGDAEALHALLASHLRLVGAIARRFTKHRLPFEDLVAEGNVGLVEAARLFDPARSTRFATYATWWITARIRRFTLSNRRIVGMPSTRAARRIIGALRATERRLSSELGRPATSGEVARALDVTEDDVAMVEAALGGRDASLGAEPGPGSVMLVSARPTPEDEVAERETSARNRRLLHDAIDDLDERERTIVERRLLGTKDTLSAIGADLRLSRERVRQLEVRARGKLREALLDRVA